MTDDFNVQFSTQKLLEDIEETSTTSGAGAYLPKARYKKEEGERTSGGMIYKDLWEYEDSYLSVIIDDVRSHLATSSALKISTKLEALEIADQIKKDIEGDNWESAFLMLEDLQEMLQEANPREYEEVYMEMIEKAIRKVSTLYDDSEGEEGIEEAFTRDDYEKAKQLLKKLETTNPKIYQAIHSIFVGASIDPYHRKDYGDLESATKEMGYALSEANIPDNIKKFAKTKGATGTVNQIARWAEKAGKRIVGGTAIGKHYSTLILDLTYEGGEVSIDTDNNALKVNGRPVTDYRGFEKALSLEKIYENYSRFKNETKTRPNADQFHQAIREVKKRVHEIHKVLEYVNRLKEDLSEGESGLKYRKHTEAAISKIKEMVSELNTKIRKFK